MAHCTFCLWCSCLQDRADWLYGPARLTHFSLRRALRCCVENRAHQKRPSARRRSLKFLEPPLGLGFAASNVSRIWSLREDSTMKITIFIPVLASPCPAGLRGTTRRTRALPKDGFWRSLSNDCFFFFFPFITLDFLGPTCTPPLNTYILIII